MPTVSQPTVSKPSQQPTDPKNGSSRPASGPQNKTEGSSFDFTDYRFPEDIGNIPKLLHWVKFVPNVQMKSSYNVKTTNTMGLADSNRSALKNELGSSSQAFGTIPSAAALGGIFGALATAESLANSVGDALNGDVTAEIKAIPKAAGAGVGGAAVGLFAGAVVGSIDLTRKTRRAAGSIGLYMPDTVNQTNVNDYDQVSMTQALGKAGLVMQAGGSAIEGAKAAVSSGGKLPFGQTAGSAGVAEVAGALAEKTGAFGQGITDVLLFSAGYAQNPQVELLFKTIQNREFLFDFKMVPRNEKEADTILKIIQAFRFFAAPEIPAGTGRYFIPPSEFDIYFMLGPKPNPKLPKISTCVLQGIDINYGSAGQWTAFKDGMPVEISMQLRFKEVEIMHKELIKQGF